MTHGAFRPAPKALIRVRLGLSTLIGNVLSLIMIPPRESPRRIQSAYLIRFCGLYQPGPPLTLAGAGHQYREDLLLVLAPEDTRAAGQQLPVASLQVCGITHVTTPAASFSLEIATRALACNRAASAASSSPPAGVSR